MAAAATRSENSGIFWMNGGMFTFDKPYSLCCPLLVHICPVESYKSFRKNLTNVTLLSMLESCYF